MYASICSTGRGPPSCAIFLSISLPDSSREEKALSDMLKIKETLTEHLKASSSERDGLSQYVGQFLMTNI